MSWATFLPFMSIPNWWGDCLPCGSPEYVDLPWNRTLADGISAQAVAVFLGLLTAAAVCHSFGIRQRITATICLVASAGSLLFALFEIGDGGHRLMPSWAYPGPGSVHESVTIGAGFYAFRDGAALAVIASLIMCATSFRSATPVARASLHPRLS